MALRSCNGQLDEAALWLTENAKPTMTPQTSLDTASLRSGSPTTSRQSSITVDASEKGDEDREVAYLQGSPISFSNIEVKTSSVNVCIIDDCRDADVPLLETTLSHLHLRHAHAGDGEASAAIAGSYYNRALSAWEPFLEPWSCALDWKLRAVGAEGKGQRLTANLVTTDVVNFNLTSTLVELYQVHF